MTFEEGMKLLENVPRRGALLIHIVCFFRSGMSSRLRKAVGQCTFMKTKHCVNEFWSVLSIFMIFISSIDNSTCGACQIRTVKNEISVSVNFISCARKGEAREPSEVGDYVQ